MAERSPEEIAYERSMQLKINEISEWIADHGLVRPHLVDDFLEFGDLDRVPIHQVVFVLTD